MDEDPIMAEVRRVRDARARRFNYDIHAIFADLMSREQTEDSSHPIVPDAQEWLEAGLTSVKPLRATSRGSLVA